MLNTQQITRFCEETLSLAKQEAKNGGLPFSAIIIDKHGQSIGQGVNEVNALNDCTAHAEIQAIRMASNCTCLFKATHVSLHQCQLFCRAY